jgi:hypothetical protein
MILFPAAMASYAVIAGSTIRQIGACADYMHF